MEPDLKYKSNILIVDDEPAGRKTLESLLIDPGYQLTLASSGPEALAKATRVAPDVILLDVVMPDMDGFEVCRQVRADPTLAEVPVILVTALEDRESRMQGIRVGADDFISKPFDRMELRARVRAIIDLNRYRRLLAERTRFKWVVEQAEDGYLIVDSGGHILYANPQARLYLGLLAGRPEATLETFPELAKKQFRCEPQEMWLPPLEPSPGQAPRYLVQPETPTAKAFWLQVDYLGLPAGPDTSWIIRLRDVTTQMALQRDTRAFHEMIRHKLRTPLQNAFSSLELLARCAPTLSEAEIARISERAFQSVNRLHTEIEDILDYLNAPNLAQSGACFKLAQLQPVVDEIRTMLCLEAVRVVCPQSIQDLRLLLPPRSVKLIFLEILENSKKFHPNLAPNVEIIALLSPENEVNIQICDDGVSLSPAQLAQMWHPYYQGEKHFTGEVNGMGLGLSTVAAVVWNVGGKCHAHNRQGQPGLNIELVLPLAEDHGGPNE
ncbi:MAG: response regulator [Anaerolineae bacterium]